MAGEINLESEISKEKKIHVKNKWLSYVFGPEPLKLEKYEVDPVSDIPIRLAVEKGVIPRKRDLALYRTAEDWNGHPRHSIVIAGPLEEGQPFAVWIGDDNYTPIEGGVRPIEPKVIPETPLPIPLPRSAAGREDTPIQTIRRLPVTPRRLFAPPPAWHTPEIERKSASRALFGLPHPARKSTSPKRVSRAFLALKKENF